MVAVGVWLIALGTADLVRADVDATSRRRLRLVVSVGVAVLLALTFAVDPDPSGWLVGAVGAVTLVVWVGASARAMSTSRALPRVLAFGAVGVGLLTALLADEDQYAVTWPHAVAGSAVGRLGPATVLVVVGVLLTQVATVLALGGLGLVALSRV